MRFYNFIVEVFTKIMFSRFLQTLLVILSTAIILWLGKSFLVPLTYAVLTSFVLYPITKKLENKGFYKIFSILIPIILLCIVFSGIIALLLFELISLRSKLPLVQQQMDPFLENLSLQLENEYGWTTEKQLEWLRNSLTNASQDLANYFQNFVETTIKTLFDLLIIPIYISLILLYRKKLIDLLTVMVPETYRQRFPAVIQDTVEIFSRFVRGIMMVYVIVGILNGFGLWALGVNNPFLYGMISAVMTIIPYIGIMISALLPITVTWLETASFLQPVGIIIVFVTVQYLEANLIFPYIVGRFVHLNTFVTIIAMMIGGLIWGVSGMILFVPLLAIFRVVSKHYPELKIWENFLGN